MARSIGRYEIREELGRGGMATVYLAFDSKLDREIALKLMDQQLSSDPTFAARFEREAKTVASLEHSAIVALYDYGEAEGWPFLVMRFMKGGSLKELIARGPLSSQQAYGVVRRIGSALDKAHSEGIIHRDLKPANILLDEEQEAFLSDFGIVKVATEDQEGLTQTGQTLGTNAYMSPEQVMGQALDGRSDIYALGLILYEMLSGKHPYSDSATTSGAMAVAHVQAPIPKITTTRPELPAALDEIIQKAIAKNPGDRYASCREMASALRAALSAPSTTATTAPAAVTKPAVEPPAVEPPAVEPPEPSTAPARPPAAQPAAQGPASQPPTRRAPSQPPPQQPLRPAETTRAQATIKEPSPASPDRQPPRRKTPVFVWLFAGLAGVVLLGAVVFLVLGGKGSSEEEQTRQAQETRSAIAEATRIVELTTEAESEGDATRVAGEETQAAQEETRVADEKTRASESTRIVDDQARVAEDQTRVAEDMTRLAAAETEAEQTRVAQELTQEAQTRSVQLTHSAELTRQANLTREAEQTRQAAAEQTSEAAAEQTRKAEEELAQVASAAAFDQNMWYRLSNMFKGESLSIDCCFDDGRPYMADTGNFTGQYWRLSPLGGDYYSFANMYWSDGQALDCCYEDGVPLVVEQGDVSGQFWLLIPLGDDYYRVTNMFWGEGYALDCCNVDNQPFMAEIGDYSGQYWRLTPIAPVQ